VIAKGEFTEQEAEMLADVMINLLFPKPKEFDLKTYL
jgi:hypothetical protein